MRTRAWMTVCACAPLIMTLFTGAVVANGSDSANVQAPAGPHAMRNIMVTGFWNPTGQMIAPFSTDPYLNPGGWKGGNWEGRGYDIFSFFPNPGQYNGTFVVDYQNTLADFNNITPKVNPIAIVSFGAGTGPWEIEYNARNLDSWVSDGNPPTQPTPNPPDSTKPANFVRHATLPVQNIADAVKAQTSINAWVDWNGNPGAYLCEFMAYLGMWYQDKHNSSSDPNYTAMSGFIHVVSSLSVKAAMDAVNITLREVIKALGLAGMPSSNAGPLAKQWYNALPMKVPYSASSAKDLTNVTLWYGHSTDNKTWSAWKPFAKVSVSGNSTSGSFDFTAPNGAGYYQFYTIANDTKNNTEGAPTKPDARAGFDDAPPTSTVVALPQFSPASFQISSTPSDALSGVHDLTLFYRKDAGAWTSFGTTTKSPWSWQFTASKDGLYEFYTIANDNAVNAEPAPSGNDTWTRVDTQAPQVVDSSPKNGASDVPVDAKVVITFSKNMNAQTTEAAVTAGFSYDAAWDSGKTVLTMTPKALLLQGKQYSVQIGAGATDIAGNHLSAKTITFTTIPQTQQYAWLVGTVKDESGASVAGASVKVTGAAFSQTGASGADGKYNMTVNKTGSYEITVQKNGFDTVTMNANVDALQKECVNNAILKKSKGQQQPVSEFPWIYAVLAIVIVVVAIAVVLALVMRRGRRQTPTCQYPQQTYPQDWQQQQW